MRVLRKEAAVKYLLFCLALVPALLFAYLGHFSRLMWDDYDRLGKPIELGFWQALIYFRDTWNGDYTNFLVLGLLAPLGVKAPSIFPSVIIAIWLASLVLLYRKILAFLEIKRHRYPIAIAVASLTVAVAINGLYSQQSFYWFTATVEYTLPPALLLICLMLAAKTAGLMRTRFRLAIDSLSRDCDRFRHCWLLGNVPGFSVGVFGAPCRWNLFFPRSIEAQDFSCPDLCRFLRDFSQCAGAIELTRCRNSQCRVS